MIRSCKHSIKFSNSKKKILVKEFLNEYRIALQECIDYMWNSRICQANSTVPILDIQNNILNSISYIDYKLINSKTNLSARALSSVSTQACSIISGVIKRKSKYQYVYNKLLNENNTKQAEKIKSKLDKIVISKPIIGNNIKAEISSKLIDFQFEKSSFDCFIRLKSLGEKYPHIKIPIKLTSQDKKWNKNGKLLGSILLSENNIDFRYENSDPKLKQDGIIVGADSGVNTLITLSDKQSPKEKDIHGHSFNSILDKLARKKKGSVAFRKATEHRKNFINWSINQLNLKGIKQVNLEHISNLFYKKNTSRKLKGFTNSLIEEKMKRFLEENGVRFLLTNSVYKSQRCSQCGMVHYLNRKSKIFLCKLCNFTEDADYNSSVNNSIDLPKIPNWIMSSKLNRKSGFLWKPDGIYNLDGQELRVPDSYNKIDKI